MFHVIKPDLDIKKSGRSDTVIGTAPVLRTNLLGTNVVPACRTPQSNPRPGLGWIGLAENSSWDQSHSVPSNMPAFSLMGWKLAVVSRSIDTLYPRQHGNTVESQINKRRHSQRLD